MVGIKKLATVSSSLALLLQGTPKMQVQAWSIRPTLSTPTVRSLNSVNPTTSSQPLFTKRNERRRSVSLFVTDSKTETSMATSSDVSTVIDNVDAGIGVNTNAIEGNANAVDVNVNVDDLSTSTKIINGLFLAAAFGYALYEILTIDSGMTRGWTASEIAMRIPLDNWGNYESSLAEKPIFTKTLINVIIYLLGDWLSQTVFQGKNVLNFDLKRTLRNGFIGLCFGPLVHEYYQFSDTILPPEDGMITRLQKIFMDQTIYLTVKCSIYIAAVGLLGGDDLETVQGTVKTKIGGIVITAWKFWPLVHCITYGVIPARHRILWVNSVDLIWNAILATQAQKSKPQDEVVEANNSNAVAIDGAVVADNEESALVTALKSNFLGQEPANSDGSESESASHVHSQSFNDYQNGTDYMTEEILAIPLPTTMAQDVNADISNGTNSTLVGTIPV